MGDILLLVRIPSASASASAFISMHYLLNHFMDLNETCIGTLLGGGEGLIRCGDFDPFLRSQGHFEISYIWFPSVIF